MAQGTRIAYLNPPRQGEGFKEHRATNVYIRENDGVIGFTFHLPEGNISNFLKSCGDVPRNPRSLLQNLTSKSVGSEQLIIIEVSLSRGELQIIAKSARFDLVSLTHKEDPRQYRVSRAVFIDILSSLEESPLLKHTAASRLADSPRRQREREVPEPTVVFQSEIQPPGLREPLPPSNRPQSSFERKARQRGKNPASKKGKGKK